MRSVNLNHFADGVASCHCGKTLKLGIFLNEVRRNTLVALHLQPQTCNFFWNLSWKWLTLKYCSYKISYISNYRPEKMFDVDLMCPIGIEKTKTKMKLGILVIQNVFSTLKVMNSNLLNVFPLTEFEKF